MTEVLALVDKIAPDDLDGLERTAQAVATRIGPHEGRWLHRVVRDLAPGSAVVSAGDCPGAMAYLVHASAESVSELPLDVPTELDSVAVVLVCGEASYDHARKSLERWWPLLVEGGVIAFLDAQETGVRVLLEERVFASDHMANVGYIGRMVYGRKRTRAGAEEKRKNRRVLRLWHAHLKLQKVPMPRPVRVVGREAMRKVQPKG